MRRVWLCWLIALSATGAADAQTALSQLLSGNLVNPHAGVWAWYELTDSATKDVYFLRQAIVGEEQSGKDKGYWLEVQVRPKVGFPTTYKMLLTGPASDPDNIKRIYFKSGEDPVEMIEPKSLQPDKPAPRDAPTPQGQQTVDTPDGQIACNYYKLEDGSEFWLSDAVPPMGIVQYRTKDGELKLQRHGEGGPDAETQLPEGGKDSDAPSKKGAAGKNSEARPVNALPTPAAVPHAKESKKKFTSRSGKP